MKKTKLINGIVIFFMLGHVKKYITGHTLKGNNTYLPRYGNKPEDAVPFLEQKEVNTYLSRTYNPYHREFETETVLLPADSFKPGKQRNDETIT
ncbi:MAG: hypothetical protein M0Q26_13930 [Chitinophagaceae bacterium]|nr:hypothetical protein [Chitinophagaceae bacterium]MDP1763448.1 hypothetical protein [Sediminibacterium sp.]